MRSFEMVNTNFIETKMISNFEWRSGWLARAELSETLKSNMADMKNAKLNIHIIINMECGIWYVCYDYIAVISNNKVEWMVVEYVFLTRSACMSYVWVSYCVYTWVNGMNQ